MSPYVYLWEFRVRPGHEAEFERHYGPNGTWVDLFRTSPGYLDTTLLRDRVEPGRYLTIDRWESEHHWRDFRAANATNFDALDARCEALTVSEQQLGNFDAVP